MAAAAPPYSFTNTHTHTQTPGVSRSLSTGSREKLPSVPDWKKRNIARSQDGFGDRSPISCNDCATEEPIPLSPPPPIRGASKSRDATPSLGQRQLVHCLSIFRMLCWVELCGLPRLVSSPRGVWTSPPPTPHDRPPPTPASHPDGCQGRHKATYFIVHKAVG